MLSNIDIIEIFTSERTNRPYKAFKGCFMKDELSNMTPEENSIYIVNLDSSDGPGTHWNTAVTPGHLPETIIFFDPYGTPPPKDVESFMRRARDKNGNPKKMIYNREDIQSLHSTFCGWYTSYFAWQCVLRKRSMIDILNDFHHGFKTWMNDKLVRRFMKHILQLQPSGIGKAVGHVTGSGFGDNSSIGENSEEPEQLRPL